MQASDVRHIVCLSPQQLLTLQAITEPLHWLTRWSSPTGVSIDPDVIDAFASELERTLMDTTCLSSLQFRTDPNNSCRIQYSTDGGLTWSTVWDAGVCMTRHQTNPSISTDIYNDARTEIIDQRTIYSGNITNIYPNWQYEGGGDDQYRDEALCYLIRVFINALCDTAIAAADHSLTEDIWGIITSIAGGLKSGYDIFISLVDDVGEWALLPAVAVAIGKSAWGIYDTLKSVNISHFQDTSAREEVICTIWCAMQGQTPSFALWQNSLEHFAGTENGHEIADVISPLLEDEDAFMTQFLAFGDAITVAKSGVDLGCPCDVEDCPEWWCRHFDFGEGEGNLQGWELDWGHLESFGIHSELYGDVFKGGAHWHIGGMTIEYLKVEVGYNGEGSSPVIELAFYDAENNVLAQNGQTLQGGPVWYTLRPDNPIANVARVAVFVHVNATGSVSFGIYRAQVSGYGSPEPTDGAPC